MTAARACPFCDEPVRGRRRTYCGRPCYRAALAELRSWRDREVLAAAGLTGLAVTPRFVRRATGRPTARRTVERLVAEGRLHAVGDRVFPASWLPPPRWGRAEVRAP